MKIFPILFSWKKTEKFVEALIPFAENLELLQTLFYASIFFLVYYI